MWMKMRDHRLMKKGTHACLIKHYQIRLTVLNAMFSYGHVVKGDDVQKDEFVIQQLEHSHWRSRSLASQWLWPWGVEYTGTRATRAGYSWEKIPRNPE